MKKIFAVLTLLLVMIFGIGAPQTAQATLDEDPVVTEAETPTAE